MAGSILRIMEFLTKLNNNTLYGDKSDYTLEQIKDNQKTINRLCKQEINYLRKHVELKTLRRYRSDYRNEVKQYFRGKKMALTHTPKYEKEQGHIALKYLVLKRNEVITYGKNEKARKEAYLIGNRVLINQYEKLIIIGVQLLESTNLYEIAIGLLLLSGRRPIEIFKTGSFDFVSQNKVLFTGQAKTRESEQAQDNYEIYTLCDAKLVCSALHKLRSQKDFSQKTNRQVESTTSGRLGLTLRKYFKDDDFFKRSNDGTLNNLQKFNGIDPNSLRDIWLNITHHKIEPLADIHHFATRMLGHISGSTASNYMEFMIIPKK
jgi:hypothetical protein